MIGGRETFGIDLVPVEPSWERRYAPESAAWAGLAIWVDGRNLCRNVRHGEAEIREYLYVPLAPIADWLIHAWPAVRYEERPSGLPGMSNPLDEAEWWFNARPPRGFGEDAWLDEREAWWARHFVRAGADGAQIPDIALSRQDEQLVISWGYTSFPGVAPPELLEPPGSGAVPFHEGESVVDGFVADVAETLRMSRSERAYGWVGESRPLATERVSSIEALHLMSGTPTDVLIELFAAIDNDDLLAKFGVSVEADVGTSPEVQMLRDTAHPGVNVAGAITDVGSAVRRGDSTISQAWNVAREVAIDAARAADSPEGAGQLAATEIRELLGLDAQPLGSDLEPLLERVGVHVTRSEVEGGPNRMLVAAMSGGGAFATVLDSPRTRARWGARFEACRAAGHALLDPLRGGVTGAASSPYAQEVRRRRSGAFAAELLLPDSALAVRSQSELDQAADQDTFRDLLHEFGIGATAAAHQLYNHHWLSSPVVRDELIERFSQISE